jgi:large subunit ribosomal protein L25
MKTVSLSGSRRENVGKKDAKKQRREGKIPCVIYGGEKQIHFSVEELSFDGLIFTPDVFIINIDIDGKNYQSVMQEVQYHPVTDKVLHADFVEIVEGKEITVGLPTRLIGDSMGVMKGGKLIHKMHKVKVRGLIGSIPDFVEVDITQMDIGGSIKIKDLTLGDLELLDHPNGVIVRVKTARVEAELEGDEEEDEEGEGVEGEEGSEEPKEAPAAE